MSDPQIDIESFSYEEKIRKALKSCISEKELVIVRNRLLQGIKNKSNNCIVIEKNLPKKSSTRKNDNFRGSTFRGPSKNRKKWQVMKMINKETIRIGAINSELEAARIYDFLAILTEGLNVSNP